MKVLMLVVALAPVAAICNAADDGTQVAQSATTNANAAAASKQEMPFDIPPSLVYRMTMAHNAARNRQLKSKIDAEELWALAQKDSGFTNAHIIAERPRGEMKFCDDLLSEKEREELWPFDVEAFEKQLEAKMVRDREGRFRLVRKCLDEVAKTNDLFSPVPTLKAAHLELRDDELEASNPTIRWVNHEIEQWAIKQLDSKFKRMDDNAYCKMTGEEKAPDGVLAWKLGSFGEQAGEYFVVQQSDGAWKAREYTYILWDGGKKVVPVASFDSFPNRKEAAAMRIYVCDIAAIHNLAVLEWRHRVNRLSMEPRRIKRMLEVSKEKDVPTADGNLKVLQDHIPEVF